MGSGHASSETDTGASGIWPLHFYCLDSLPGEGSALVFGNDNCPRDQHLWCILRCQSAVFLSSCSHHPQLGPSAPHFIHPLAYVSLRMDLVAEVGDQLLSFFCSLKHVSKLQGACKKMQLLNELMDWGGNYVAAALPFVVSLLTRGLARRALLVAHALPQIPEVMQLGNDTASFAAPGVLCVPRGTAGCGDETFAHWGRRQTCPLCGIYRT